jgi:methionyl-tRNA synthetase
MAGRFELRERSLAPKMNSRVTYGVTFHRALEAVWSALDYANRYIVQTSPFTMIKDDSKKARVGEVLHHLLEVVYLARVLARLCPRLRQNCVHCWRSARIGLRRWGQGLTAG